MRLHLPLRYPTLSMQRMGLAGKRRREFKGLAAKPGPPLSDAIAIGNQNKGSQVSMSRNWIRGWLQDGFPKRLKRNDPASM